MQYRNSASVLPLCFMLLFCCTGSAQATETPVALQDNFGTGEQVFIWGTIGAGLTLYLLQPQIVQALDSEPRITGPLPWELAITEALYQGPDYHLLGSAPDVAGNYIFPGLSLLYYGSGGLTQLIRGTSWTGNPNANHAFMAFAEAYALNLTLTQTVKMAVGRERPIYYLNRDPALERDDDTNLSFFSGHSSSSFCLAAFVNRDIGDALIAGPLSSSSATEQLLLGRIAPGVVLYGLAGLVGFSRIIDQKHWTTDVLVGATLGTLIGNLVYARHFDALGKPRQRATASSGIRQLELAFAPPAYLSLGGAF